MLHLLQIKQHKLSIVTALLLLLALLNNAYAKSVVIPMSHFSDDYHATVTIDSKDNDEVFKSGVIKVYDHSNKKIIEVASDELAFEVEDGATPANIKELPYGRQSLLIYDDFNFDGHKDLAIMDGQNSCYHGPSFQIYVATAHGFRLDNDFTRLAQEYCGMFETNAKNKTINVMTKSGCCEHIFETYQVMAGKLKLLVSSNDQLIGESLFEYGRIVDTFGEGKQAKTHEHIYLNVADPKENNTGDGLATFMLFTFNLAKQPNKSVFIVKNSDHDIDYALVNHTQKDAVELSYSLAIQGLYPENQKRVDQLQNSQASIEDDPYQLQYNCALHALSFSIGDVHYQVTDNPHLGITVMQHGKTTFLAGDPATRHGSLAALQDSQWKNIKHIQCS